LPTEWSSVDRQRSKADGQERFWRWRLSRRWRWTTRSLLTEDEFAYRLRSRTADGATEKLTVSLSAQKENMRNLTLCTAWGRLQLSIPEMVDDRLSAFLKEFQERMNAVRTF